MTFVVIDPIRSSLQQLIGLERDLTFVFFLVQTSLEAWNLIILHRLALDA
jgi:hypothetical protein